MTITLYGLTARQKSVMELLWNCNTLDQAKSLIAALPTERDRVDAHTMLTMVAWDNLENMEGLDQYADAASAAIARASS